MPILDAFGQRKKHNVMKDTWGHLYPEPGSKHHGNIIVAVGEMESIIISSYFYNLGGSPQRSALETEVFEFIPDELGVYKVDCVLWFFKSSNNIYLGEKLGKIIKVKVNHILKI